MKLYNKEYINKGFLIKKCKKKRTKMLNKILILLIITDSINSLSYLNSEDLCRSFTCKGKFKHQCAKGLCSFNLKTCYDFQKLDKSDAASILIGLKQHIMTCESKILQTNNYKKPSLNGNNAFRANKQKSRT